MSVLKSTVEIFNILSVINIPKTRYPKLIASLTSPLCVPIHVNTSFIVISSCKTCYRQIEGFEED